MFDFSKLKSVADISRVHARERPHSVALDFRDRVTTYAELDRHASQVAQGLIALGQMPGARVGYIGKNSDRYFEALLGAFKARCVIVGVNWRLAPPEIAYVLNDAGCEVLFVGRDYLETVEKVLPDCPRLKTVIAVDGGHPSWPAFESWRDAQDTGDPMLPVAPDDDAIQLYTSGTTGHPKGVQITNANYLSIFACLGSAPLGQYEPEDAVLIAMPIFHVAGVNIGLLALAQGAHGVVLGETDPGEILRLIATKRITYAFLVPALILFVMQHPDARTTDFSSLKNISYGASPISDDVLLRAKAMFGCEFLQVYGLTETTGGGTFLLPEDHDPARGKLRSCGRPAPGHEIRVVGSDNAALPPGEVGEIQIRAGNVMKGYWNKEEATRKAVCRERWFSTGDAGFFDADGYLYIHDRVKDMIVSGGENIYPAEVENALMGHPAIADVAVIGVPDERWGEAVKAIVVKKPGIEAPPDEIIAYARQRIAGYKLPKSVDFVDTLPRNPSGKVLRKDLRRPYWEGRERQVN
ncbi:MAG TPA: long-chain-fatty-acid--CoA ligase [Rhizomicrobium sp.]|jgi:fatty-acyl-CoA synthase|nr:long-chain-fatty-acid--CoA ligase [Rhizomicrobium sp.]